MKPSRNNAEVKWIAGDPVSAHSESINLKDALTTITVPVHENPLIKDYIGSRFFNGFELRIQKNNIVLVTGDSTVITMLERSKIIKDTDENSDDLIEVDIMSVLPKRNTIKKVSRDMRWQYESEVIDLLEALNTINSFGDPTVKQRIQEGFAAYSDMPVLFSRGVEAIVSTPSGPLGGTVESCVEVSSFFGNYYNVSMSCILPTSKGCCLGRVSHRIYDFESTKMPIEKLGIRPINESEKATLSERGAVFREFTKEPTASTYSGNLTIPSWMRDRIMSADGRAMVDSLNFAQVEADLYYEIMRPFGIDEESKTGIVKDEDLWRCYNRVHGFSMRLKRWGWLDVNGLKPVKWRDNAFNQLVLSPDHKNAVLHLVTHYGAAFTDFIEDKSGGLVFLLHGPTGTGKTLCSEAVAETLHRPLYSVSVGELGTSPEELEGRLRGILDLAYQWNAVLLFDEADIFMEARDTNNIARNAMVSIFLRLLEYYSGVLFLTTNRVTTFDPAFFSRISMAISFPKLVAEDRQSVWKNILLSSGVANEEYEFTELSPGRGPRFNLKELAKFEVNGRNIKTAVRIAQTMATGSDRPVTQADLISVLKLTEKFNDDVGLNEKK